MANLATLVALHFFKLFLRWKEFLLASGVLDALLVKATQGTSDLVHKPSHLIIAILFFLLIFFLGVYHNDFLEVDFFSFDELSLKAMSFFFLGGSASGVMCIYIS